MAADGSGVFSTPGIPGAIRAFQDSARIFEEPDGHASMEAPHAQFRGLDEQMAKVVQHTEMQFVTGNRGLRDLSIIVPCAEVGRGIAGRDICILFSDQKTAGELQQVDMLLITPVEKPHATVVDTELAQQDRRRLALIFISQEPGVIALAWCRLSQAVEIDLQLINDTLVAASIQLPATDKEGMPDESTRWSSTSRNER